MSNTVLKGLDRRPEIRIVGCHPVAADGEPPEIAEGIYYVGKHRGRHVLHVYPYVHEEGSAFDVEAWDASRQRIEIPHPLTARTWRIAFALARRVLFWGQNYYRGLANERNLMLAQLAHCEDRRHVAQS